jgi:hypothetical protein
MRSARPPPATGFFQTSVLEIQKGTVQENIAKTTREGWAPELREAMRLPQQAQHLDSALKVAVKWMKVAGDGSPRARYEVMGALMVAHDAANAKMERLDAAQPATA